MSSITNLNNGPVSQNQQQQLIRKPKGKKRARDLYGDVAARVIPWIFKNFTSEQIETINPKFFDKCSANLCERLKRKRARPLSNEEVAQIDIEKVQIESISGKLISRLDQKQIGGLSGKQIGCFSREQFESLSGKQIGWFSREQFESLSGKQIGWFNRKQLKCLGWPNINCLGWPNNWLSVEQFKSFSGKQFRWFTQNQIRSLGQQLTQAMSREQFKSLSGKQIGWFDYEALQSLSNEQIGWFSRKRFKWLSDGQIASFRQEQLESLSVVQIGWLSVKQLESLSVVQIKRLAAIFSKAHTIGLQKVVDGSSIESIPNSDASCSESATGHLANSREKDASPQSRLEKLFMEIQEIAQASEKLSPADASLYNHNYSADRRYIVKFFPTIGQQKIPCSYLMTVPHVKHKKTNANIVEVANMLDKYYMADLLYEFDILAIGNKQYRVVGKEKDRILNILGIADDLTDGPEHHISSYLGPADFEVIDFEPTHIEQDDVWSNWKKIFDGANVKRYRDILYPSIKGYAPQLFPLGRTVRVLDICGGDGEFAKGVLDLFSNRISKWIIVERNEDAVENAKEHLYEYIGTGKVVVIRGDAADKDYLRHFMEGEQIDVALAMGALTKQVLTRSVCLHVLDQLSRCLRRGGKLWATGYARPRICAKDLTQRGYEVPVTHNPKLNVEGSYSNVYLAAIPYPKFNWQSFLN